jgi:hypothetical protein
MIEAFLGVVVAIGIACVVAAFFIVFIRSILAGQHPTKIPKQPFAKILKPEKPRKELPRGR